MMNHKINKSITFNNESDQHSSF